MELSDIKEKIFNILDITQVNEIKEKLMTCVKNADEKIYSDLLEVER